MSYQIESGVPVPPKKGASAQGLSGTLRSMKVGDSVRVPIPEMANARARITYIQKTTAAKFVARKTSDSEGRVWRVA